MSIFSVLEQVVGFLMAAVDKSFRLERGALDATGTSWAGVCASVVGAGASFRSTTNSLFHAWNLHTWLAPLTASKYFNPIFLIHNIPLLIHPKTNHIIPQIHSYSVVCRLKRKSPSNFPLGLSSLFQNFCAFRVVGFYSFFSAFQLNLGDLCTTWWCSFQTTRSLWIVVPNLILHAIY